MDEIRFIGDMEKLTLNQDDHLVLSLSVIPTREQMAQITKAMELAFPGGHVLILQPGMELQIVTQPDIAQRLK